VIMPMAGKGTRLLPLTKRVPKPLVNVAGRPVMDYVMDALRRAGKLDELIIITGHLKEKVEAYVRKNYDIPARFIEQKVLDGTAGAVNLARPYVDGPVIVIFVDTLFDADLSIVKNTKADGIIWTKEVEDYQRFGVVVTDKQGHMTKIVEKPNTPISKRANIGLQYVKDWRTLFDGIEHVLKSPPGKGGEFFLTDAFQYMVDQGVTLKDSEVGPNVAVEAGSTIEGSTVTNSILGRGVQVKNAKVLGSVIGDKQVIDGRQVTDSVMDAGELAPAR